MMTKVPARRRLRFAVLCDAEIVERWQLRALQELEASGLAECVAIAFPASPSQAVPVRRKGRRGRHFLYHVFQRWSTRRCPAMAPGSIVAAFPLSATIRLAVESLPKGRTGVAPEGLAELRELRLDFAVRFGFGILSGDILQEFPLGMWSYHHGDPARFRGQPPGLWEMYHGASTTGAIVQRLDEHLDGGDILAAATLPTVEGSYARQLDGLLSGSIPLLAMAARRHVFGGGKALKQIEQGALYSKPANGQMVRLVVLCAVRRIRAIMRSFFIHQHWGLVASNTSLEEILRCGMNVPLDRYLSDKRPFDEGQFFAADPFLVERTGADCGGRIVLFERFDWRSGKGHIASVTLDKNGSFSDLNPIVSLDTHLSYPMTYTKDGRCVVLPESVEGEELIEYEFDEESNSASRIGEIGVAVFDPTIIFHENKYWMFYCGDGRTTLCIRHALRPEGPWTEHPGNPVKIDVLNARPAGAVLSYGSELYRPAQICAPFYGQGVVLNRIVRLDENTFEEEPVASILPAEVGAYRAGVHTLAIDRDVAVFDIARNKFSLHELIRQVRQKSNGLFVKDGSRVSAQ